MDSIYRFLLKRGVDPELRGFEYMAHAIQYCIDHHINAPKMSDVNAYLARTFNVSVDSVESCLVHLCSTLKKPKQANYKIKTTINYLYYDYLYNYKETNNELIEASVPSN